MYVVNVCIYNLLNIKKDYVSQLKLSNLTTYKNKINVSLEA